MERKNQAITPQNEAAVVSRFQGGDLQGQHGDIQVSSSSSSSCFFPPFFLLCEKLYAEFRGFALSVKEFIRAELLKVF